MPFVKLDVGILDSTLWLEKDQRDVFITALLMAKPKEFSHSLHQIEIRTLNETGFVAPSGTYGFIEAASVSIINRAQVEREKGLSALEDLGKPELESRSSEYEGRRLIRVEGGFIVLNYQRYRDKDNPNRSPFDTPGYVYYVGTTVAKDNIKIGFSKNPWARLGALRTTNPKLEILAIEKGTMQLEKDRQEQFKSERLEGEWFKRSESLFSLIKLLRESTPTRPSSRKYRTYPNSYGSNQNDYGSLEAEAEAEAVIKNTIPRAKDARVIERIYLAYPRRVGKTAALKAIEKALRQGHEPEWLLERVHRYAEIRAKEDQQFTPHPATWFNEGRYMDDEVSPKEKNLWIDAETGLPL